MKSLETLYKELDFASGDLLTATDNPSLCPKQRDWLEKGEWLSAAKRAGVEKVFFIENNPVVVFAECVTDDLLEKVKAFNRAWCLARPRLLFLASPGEITVYDLAQKPVVEENQDKWKNLKHLEILHDIKKVSEDLQQFHRDNIVSGRIFGDKRFGDLKNRADKALIRDLKTVRRELIDAGLSGMNVRFTHALIGRSIFIRYLEDRGVLTENYFRKVAGKNDDWVNLLVNQPKRAGIDFSGKKTFYQHVLRNKDFTYRLFRVLANDFNGDMFPDVETEEQIVSQKHLTKVQGLLYGDTGLQKKLFFYSYQFDIIPLDLISSIYEEFYHSSASEEVRKSTARQGGAYYTPPVLAEFLLSRVLTPETIKNTPRILDPACGSGIFLVEAFRRIVRYQWHRKKSPLTLDELKTILKEQIAGIEVNEEAARITAFSLCLSLLHYLDPPAIDQHIKRGYKLPCLIATDEHSPNHYHCILPQNAFHDTRIESNPLWRKRFGSGCADVIVGNPPWGAPGRNADAETRAREGVVLNWCKNNNKPIGDKEPSQAFLWRALDFLKSDGKAGMLVSAGVLFKHGTKSQKFRKMWLDCIRLTDVYNFTHVRKFFFKGADAPFLAICFNKQKQSKHLVHYWSAKQVQNINNIQAVIFSKYDMIVLRDAVLTDAQVWKQFWFGRFLDKRLLDNLSRQARLADFVDRNKSGQGYKIAAKKKEASQLQSYRSLDIDSFTRYGQLNFLQPPKKVECLGIIDTYSGSRLLVKRGISEKGAEKGQIVTRYESAQFCFTSAIHGIKLKEPKDWKYQILLGILWSSLSRYFFFMISSNWGLWHHEIHLDDELLQLPIVLEKESLAAKQVISIVNKLRRYHPQTKNILHRNGISESKINSVRHKLKEGLNEAVFELYGLNEEQKGLIRDCCEVTLPFFYKPFDSVATMPAVENEDLSWIKKYVNIFCHRWNAYLGNDEEMRAEVHVGAHGNMVAIEFFPAEKSTPWDLKPKDDSWSYILDQLGKSLPRPLGSSQILLDGLVHVVSKQGIIIIKRNKKRFWTRSMAREDADATICKAMINTLPEASRNH
jgi:type I restriction-modification system DNA methylase subunit